MEELKYDRTEELVPVETDGKWLTFRLDGQLYGVPVSCVEQILSMMPITEVPEYPYYSKGIINVRGSIVPVIDLRLRLGRTEAENTDYSCIIICRIHENLIGFIADGVDSVLEIPEDSITAPPQIGGNSDASYLTGIARIIGEDQTETLVLCLDAVQALLNTDQDN